MNNQLDIINLNDSMQFFLTMQKHLAVSTNMINIKNNLINWKSLNEKWEIIIPFTFFVEQTSTIVYSFIIVKQNSEDRVQFITWIQGDTSNTFTKEWKQQVNYFIVLSQVRGGDTNLVWMARHYLLHYILKGVSQ